MEDDRWTDHRLAIQILYKEGWDYYRIARVMNLTAEYVRRRLIEYEDKSSPR